MAGDIGGLHLSINEKGMSNNESVGEINVCVWRGGSRMSQLRLTFCLPADVKQRQTLNIDLNLVVIVKKDKCTYLLNHMA